MSKLVVKKIEVAPYGKIEHIICNEDVIVTHRGGAMKGFTFESTAQAEANFLNTTYREESVNVGKYTSSHKFSPINHFGSDLFKYI